MFHDVVTGTVRALLRLEGCAALILAVAIYFAQGGSPWLFVPLVLAVDVSMVGYLANARVGAVTYNALHSWVPGVLVLGLGLWTADGTLTIAGTILAAHVGMDRLFGYGLKYPTAFADTHLGRIGKKP
ncbi:MAG: DUF4260 domain-containing protein [Chloroflexota bacterium]|nr:DUF4260 domain-containing protein [Chloroflexota bacterium]